MVPAAAIDLWSRSIVDARTTAAAEDSEVQSLSIGTILLVLLVRWGYAPSASLGCCL